VFKAAPLATVKKWIGFENSYAYKDTVKLVNTETVSISIQMHSIDDLKHTSFFNVEKRWDFSI
jgi:hypothetical protein